MHQRCSFWRPVAVMWRPPGQRCATWQACQAGGACLLSRPAPCTSLTMRSCAGLDQGKAFAASVMPLSCPWTWSQMLKCWLLLSAIEVLLEPMSTDASEELIAASEVSVLRRSLMLDIAPSLLLVHIFALTATSIGTRPHAYLMEANPLAHVQACGRR